MRSIASFVTFAFAYFATVINNAFATQYGGVYMSPEQSGVIGGMKYIALVIVVGLLYVAWRLLKRASSFAYRKSKDKINDVVLKHTINNEHYALAEKDIESGNIDAGLWAKALVNAKGDETVRKSEYVKLRAKEIHQQQIK